MSEGVEVEIEPNTDLPSGEPVPSAAQPLPNAQPLPLSALLAAAPSNADAFLAHLQRCLSTPAGIDTTALFLCYTSRLAAAGLEALTRPALQRGAQQLLALAQSLPPSATILFSAKGFPSPSAALFLTVAKRLKAFSAMLSEARTFLRLWGLLNLYFWARGMLLQLRAARRARAEGVEGPKVPKAETAIAVTQLVACVVFQSLENAAYLAQKGVLEWQPARIGQAYRWSARFWGAFVGLKIGELFFEAYRRGQRTPAERLGDKTVAVMEQEERSWSDEWRKTVVRQLAWFPLTIHWSLEQGIFSDMTVGAIATIPGVVQMRDLWKKTAQ